MKNILKCKKGITLVELLVALSLISLALTVAYNVLFFNLDTYATESDLYDVQTDVRFVTDHITRKVRTATSLDILTDAPSESTITSTTDNYILFDSDGSVKFYMYDGSSHKKSSYSTHVEKASSGFSNVDDDTLKISVKATSDGQEYESEVNIYLVNFELMETTTKIDGQVTGKAIKFTLP